MSGKKIQVRELVGWDLDDYEYRANDLDDLRFAFARRKIAERDPFETLCAVDDCETAGLEAEFAAQARRADLRAEMAGLRWSLGVLDLRRLVAFQRRLCFQSSLDSCGDVPIGVTQQDWTELIALAFGSAKQPAFEMKRTASDAFVLQSDNPNLHFRISSSALAPITVHAGSPFFEVAYYCDRWFLRDGYHRAYQLLRAGIFKVPAVIVEARNLEEVGALQPWFFGEDILFSPRPPMVTDFMEDDLNIDYERVPLIKTLHVTMRETLAPAATRGD